MRPYHRYLAEQIERDLQKKMVFVAGPRQVGKTTLARSLEGAEKGYLNWDVPEHRERILKRQLPVSSLWVFDEIHKYRLWRNYLKGLYDGKAPGQRILVTGSARLDYYRYSGDSLQGRYHLLHLHPLSFAELGGDKEENLQRLLTLGGFPEPFFGGSEVEARRWSREHRNLLVREEMVSLERVQDLGNVELLMIRLPELVGSPLSVNALREDLQVSHKTVASWLQILERLFAIFRLSPFGSPAIRAVKKEQKHYHFDWTLVPDLPPRFEKHQQDTQGRDLELRYFRDVDGREVDFVVTERRKPVLMVEAKWADTELDRSLRYLKTRFPESEAWQISANGRRDYVSPEGIRAAPASAFLAGLA
jgi:hypothetical protein